ncbi:T-cell surface glycoprotein CD4-like [Xiphophorus couchianus]|uniref:T-cell surface glycoprotein CD4-like n=1 Tax=Xiphophorus couchianus TaxID=32473 RepID=UPI0010170087|nr:T-cell surface glycoprotein CD4-like [Xiphophorus couchianus]
MKTIILFGLVLGALSAADKVYITDVGGKVTLQCDQGSFKQMVEWYRGDTRIIRVQRNGLSSKGKTPFKDRIKSLKDTDIEISNVQESDSGKFTCVADGLRKEHLLIVVSVSVVPSGTLKVGADATLECKTNPGVSLQPKPNVKWQKPDGSVETKPKVELKHVAPSDKGTWTCLVSHEGETFNKSVTINVEEHVETTTPPAIVENSKSSNLGNGENSTGGVRGFGHPIRLLGLVWWIWVAIGAGGLVVIILIIVIIVVHKRNKRKKKKFLRMKKAQLSQKPKKYCQCVRQTAAAKPRQGRRREKPSALPLQPLLQK